jgi:ABC-type branched-subunit amino acid transport system substrate-binding protein
VSAAVVVVTSGLLIAVNLGSSSGDTAPGVNAKFIELGSHQPLTGPAAAGYREVSLAASAFYKYINSHGGVYGRSIILDAQDDAYNPVATVSTVHRLVEQDNVFAIDGGLGSATHKAVVDYLNGAGVPDLFVESGCTCFNSPKNLPQTFGFIPNYKIEGKILGQLVNTSFATQQIAYIYQDDDLGQGSQEGLDQIEPPSKVVTRQSYDAETLSQGLSAQVQAARDAGAKVVVLFGIPQATALALVAAQQLHYHPTFVVNSNAADSHTLTALLANMLPKDVSPNSLTDGIITDGYLPSADDATNPWIVLFKQVHDTYETDQPFDNTTVNGMALAYATYQALHAAGPNLTRQGLLNALVTQGSTFMGPNLAPFGFSATNHNGIQGVEMGVITGGKLQLSGPILVTDDHDALVNYYIGPHPGPPSAY